MEKDRDLVYSLLLNVQQRARFETWYLKRTLIGEPWVAEGFFIRSLLRMLNEFPKARGLEKIVEYSQSDILTLKHLAATQENPQELEDIEPFVTYVKTQLEILVDDGRLNCEQEIGEKATKAYLPVR